jgi:hypothetical protein
MLGAIGATVRFFGTAKACAGREVLTLIIGQVSCRTPITCNKINTPANNVRPRTRSGARVHMHPPPTCSLPLQTRHAHANCVPLRKALFDSSSSPHSKDGLNPSSFLTQLWCSSSIGRVDYKLRHSDCAAKCSGPSVRPDGFCLVCSGCPRDENETPFSFQHHPHRSLNPQSFAGCVRCSCNCTAAFLPTTVYKV